MKFPLDPEKLPSKLNTLNLKKKERNKLSTPEVEYLEFCEKIGRKPPTIALWLKLIAVSPEIQTIELFKPVEIFKSEVCKLSRNKTI